MDDKELTENELLQALLDAAITDGNDDGALTTAEMASALGRSRKWVRSRLRVLIEEGIVEPLRVARTRIDGQVAIVSAYRRRR